MLGRLVQIIIILYSVACVASYAQDRPRPTLEHVDQLEKFSKSLRELEDLKSTGDALVSVKTQQCMKSIGNSKFCSCVAQEGPKTASFIDYVVITANSKEDLKYDQRSVEVKEFIMAVHKAREVCVK